MDKGDRIERVVIVINNKPNNGYINIGHITEFKDEDGNKYLWNTVSKTALKKGQKWKVEMTIDTVNENKRYWVSGIAFIEKL